MERTRLCDEAGGPTFSMEVASPRTTRCRYRKRTKLGHNETCGSITGGSDTGFDPVVVLAERKKKFDRDGCVVLDDFFTEDQVGLLRRECDAILRRASGLTEEEDAASYYFNLAENAPKWWAVPEGQVIWFQAFFRS